MSTESGGGGVKSITQNSVNVVCEWPKGAFVNYVNKRWGDPNVINVNDTTYLSLFSKIDDEGEGSKISKKLSMA